MSRPAEPRTAPRRSGAQLPSVRGRALSDATISKMVRELGIGAVPHRFRSSFRDWTAECSDAPREVCELALAHMNPDRVEAAYRRTALFERRRGLMEEWAAFLAGIKGERARLAVQAAERAFRSPASRAAAGTADGQESISRRAGPRGARCSCGERG